MRIAVFQWPDDLEAHERAQVGDVENIAREAVRNVPTGARGPSDAWSRLEDALIRSVAAPPICRLLRIVTDHEPLGAIRVRFTWHRYELERRQADRRARERLAQEDRGRRERVLERLVENDAANGPRPHLATPIRDIARSAMTPAQWGSARDGRGVCGICEAGPSMWCDTVAHERRRGTTTVVAGGTIPAGAMVTVSDGEIRDARENPLNLNATRMLEEAERLEAMGLTPRDLATMPREEIERAAASLSSLSAEGRATYDRLLAHYAAPMPGTSSSYGLASGRALDAEERRSSEDREYRREVLGEWAEPAFGLGPRSNPHARRDHVADSAYYARGWHASPTSATWQQILAALLRDVSAEDVRRGYIVRQREEAGSTVTTQVLGTDTAALEAVITSRRDGDRFYFVKASPPMMPLAPPSLRAEDPGYYARRGLEARQRDAVDRLLLIMLRIAQAHARALEAARLFYDVLRGILRAWSANPGLLELDVEVAPFGVDTAPPADDALERFALLELER